MKELILGFKSFLLRGNVIEIAVAFVIASAFLVVVQSFVTYLLTPLIAAIFGEPSVGNIDFTVNGAVFEIGAFVDAVIAFIAIAAAIYFVVVVPYTHYTQRMKSGEESDPGTKVCPECVTSIAIEARRCPACTTQLVA